VARRSSKPADGTGGATCRCLQRAQTQLLHVT
jgi:hypothetical protein